MQVRPFRPVDLAQLKLQQQQSYLGGLSLQYAEALAKGGDCYTIEEGDELIACIGLIHFWPRRRYAWAFLSKDAGFHMIAMHKKIKRWLSLRGSGRIETAVDCNFPAAIRWAEMLGFEREGLMREWTDDGRDCLLYARLGG